jgi:hypothetical protein
MADLPLNHDSLLTVREEYEQIKHQTFLNCEAKVLELSKFEKKYEVMQKVLERLFRDVLKYELTQADYHENPKLAFRHLKKNVLKNRSLGKILKKERRNEKLINALFLANEQIETDLKTILGLGNNDLLSND